MPNTPTDDHFADTRDERLSLLSMLIATFCPSAMVYPNGHTPAAIGYLYATAHVPLPVLNDVVHNLMACAHKLAPPIEVRSWCAAEIDGLPEAERPPDPVLGFMEPVASNAKARRVTFIARYAEAAKRMAFGELP